jgi:hypothetical protein
MRTGIKNHGIYFRASTLFSSEAHAVPEEERTLTNKSVLKHQAT